MEPRTIVIAGDGAGPLARQVAENNGWPLLAEPTSGAMGGPNNIAAYRYVLPVLAAQPGTMPKRAIVFGRPTLNRAVNNFLANPDVEVTVVVTGEPPWPNAWLNTAAYVNGYEYGQPGLEPSNFLQLWQRASLTAAEVIQNQISQVSEAGVNPLALAQAIWEAPGQLVVGASNPIRDLDLVASLNPQGNRPTRVFSNRGVAGIDGTVATALGIAAASNPPVEERARRLETRETNAVTRLYLGDLTFLHDAASLLQTEGEPRPQLQIIIANDNGGTIFTTLEHGQWAATDPTRQQILSRVFTTPQLADIGQLCAGYGVDYRKASALKEVKAALANPCPHVEVIEVPVNGQNRQTMTKNLQQSVAESLAGIFEF